MTAAAEHRIVAGRRLEVATIPGDPGRPAIVLLHEGLGSLAMWRDFPQRLAERTQRRIVIYSRFGHGRSERLDASRAVRYMHDEGEIVLPALLDALGLERPVLFGHSDGASIALIAAAHRPAAVGALVLEAPHVFVQDLTVASIAKVKAQVAESGLIERLARYHDDAASTFWGWNDIWLHADFRGWDIRALLPHVVAPALLIQAEDDEYGTLAQLAAIAAALPHTERLVLATGGHSPHRAHEAAVLEATAAFLAALGT